MANEIISSTWKLCNFNTTPTPQKKQPLSVAEEFEVFLDWRLRTNRNAVLSLFSPRIGGRSILIFCPSQSRYRSNRNLAGASPISGPQSDAVWTTNKSNTLTHPRTRKHTHIHTHTHLHKDTGWISYKASVRCGVLASLNAGDRVRRSIHRHPRPFFSDPRRYRGRSLVNIFPPKIKESKPSGTREKRD